MHVRAFSIGWVSLLEPSENTDSDHEPEFKVTATAASLLGTPMATQVPADGQDTADNSGFWAVPGFSFT